MSKPEALPKHPEYGTDVTVKLSEDLSSKLDQMCENDVRNRSDEVRWLIRSEWLRRTPPNEIRGTPTIRLTGVGDGT